MAKLTTDNGIVTKYSGNITELVIPDGITEISDPKSFIGKGVFEGHVELTKVILPEGLIRIGESAFDGCTGLTDIVIPKSVSSIGKRAFANCENLKSIIFPEGMTCIEEFLCKGCSNLSEVVIPKSVTVIARCAFDGCSGLKKINLPENITDIGYNAFNGCCDLEKINIPEKVTKIGNSAFRNCSSLTAIEIPDNITEIESDTFAFCKSLTSISIPDHVIKIGWRAFQNCENLQNVRLSSSLSIIDNDAFSFCKEIENIIIPDSVTRIGTAAFEKCSKLKRIVLPEKTTAIEYSTFSDCSELESVTLPNRLNRIDACAFENCVELKTIEIPESIKSVSTSAFKGCGDLLINGSSFLIIDSSLKVYTGKSVALEIPEGVTEIQNGNIQKSMHKVNIQGVFSAHEEITSVTMSNSVKNIGSGAFAACINLEKIVLSDNVEKIGSYSFKDCSSLTQIVIPKGLTRIDDGTFENCKELKQINLPESIKEIGADAFKGCCNLETINLPDGISKIESGAFEGCSMLKDVSLPDNITEIGDNAFKDCTQITEISIPNGIINLQLSIFDGCNSLERIAIPASVKALSAKRDRWYGVRLEALKQIIIDPDTKFEEVDGPENLLDKEYEVSPCPMIPISLINETETKIKYFFEFCKDPSKSPAHIAEEYEKYGKSQRSRIIREAEANNRTEVIEYYEKKGHKASERKLSPEERSNLLRNAVENGSIEDLQKILKKHKIFPNATEMLEKSVEKGCVEVVSALLDHGVDYTEHSDCFLNLLESDNITEDKKIAVCKLCISKRTPNLPFSEIGFTACVLGYDEIVDFLKTNKRTNEFINLNNNYQIFEKNYYYWRNQNYRYYGSFSKLSETECIKSLQRLKDLTDPNERQEFFLCDAYVEVLFIPEVVKFIYNNFKISQNYGMLIIKSIDYKQTESLQFLLDKRQEITDSSSIEDGSLDWYISPSTFVTINHWRSESIIRAIGCGNPELLEILIDNGFLFELHSSFNKSNALRAAVDVDNAGALEILSKQGWIRTTKLRDDLIAQASDEKKNNALAWLLDYKNKTANIAKEQKVSERKELQALDDSSSKVVAAEKTQFKTSKNSDGTYAIKKYLGSDKWIVIPPVIGKRVITTIKKDSFVSDNWYAKKTIVIVISEGITSIEENAFKNYNGLKSVVFPESVVNIAEDAFESNKYSTDPIVMYGIAGSYAERFATENGYDFIALDNDKGELPDYAIRNGVLVIYNGKDNKPVIPSGVEKIGAYAFKNSDIEEITFTDEVKEIGESAFYGCKKISHIDLPKKLIKIGDYAFSWTGITEINIPDGVTEIGCAFDNCVNLKNVTIPNSLQTIRKNAFGACPKDTLFNNSSFLIINKTLEKYTGNESNVVIPDGVTSINDSVFLGHEEIHTLKLPEGISSIGDNVFRCCKNLKDFILPSSLKHIGREAFYGCTSLSHISIPESVIEVGSNAFEECSGLKSISIPSTIELTGLNLFKGCIGLINGDEKYFIINSSLEVYNGNDSEITIPDGVKAIQEGVFRNHEEIKSMSIPNSVVFIGNEAFAGCTGLINLTIPETVTKIGYEAFGYCSNLKNIVLPKHLEEMGGYMFRECRKLKKAIIPLGVMNLGWRYFYNCKSLTEVMIMDPDTEISNDAFEGCQVKKLKLIVPENSKSLQFAIDNRLIYEVVEK